jgi:hypothetical protein
VCRGLRAWACVLQGAYTGSIQGYRVRARHGRRARHDTADERGTTRQTSEARHGRRARHDTADERGTTIAGPPDCGAGPGSAAPSREMWFLWLRGRRARHGRGVASVLAASACILAASASVLAASVLAASVLAASVLAACVSLILHTARSLSRRSAWPLDPIVACVPRPP